MNHNCFYKVIILVLVVLNLGTLAFLWFGPPRRVPDSPRGKAADFLIRELNLTTTQQEEFGTLRDGHREQLLNLQAQDRDLHDRFFEVIFLPTPDTLAAKILADSIADIRRQMELLTFNHFMQLQELLKKDQKVKFHQIFRQALERVMPLPEPPLPPPPPPPPPIPSGRK